MPDIKTFAQCIAGSTGKKHVLLGNGFSRACRDHIFSYQSLFDSADFQTLSPRAKSLFQTLNTTDFEIIMKVLKSSSLIGPAYDVPAAISQLQDSDAQLLRSILIQTIAGHHPALPSDINDEEYAKCIVFLSNFEKIYTLNYDLLLYWTLMKRREQGQGEHDDGFRDPSEESSEEDTGEGFVAWLDSTNQTVYYLHGALHLFYRRELLMKYCWNRTGVRLLDQIDAALTANKFPLIVSEGESRQKLERIQKSAYLGHNHRSISKIGGSLFTFGFAFSENDKHITDQIKNNRKLSRICIGLFGTPNSEDNLNIISRAQAISAARPASKPLTVEFYDATTARVWR